MDSVHLVCPEGHHVLQIQFPTADLGQTLRRQQKPLISLQVHLGLFTIRDVGKYRDELVGSRPVCMDFKILVECTRVIFKPYRFTAQGDLSIGINPMVLGLR